MLVTSVAMVRDYVAAFRAWRARYGPVFSLPAPTGKQVVLAEPELVAELLRADEPERFGPAAPASFDALVGRRSLLLRQGRDHRQARRPLAAGLCPRRLGPWAPLVAEQTAAAFAGATRQTPLVALERSRALMLRLILRIVFGADEQRGPVLHQAVLDMLGHLHPAIMFTRVARSYLGLGPYARYLPASRRLDVQLDTLIERTRAQLDDAPECVLTMLLRARDQQGCPLDNAEIRDELRTMLIGGHETSANALAWALYFIHRDPELLASLREDLARRPAQPDAGLASALLCATIDETLRIRPIAGQLFRPLREPLSLGRWRLPAGVCVAPSIVLLHHEPMLWPEPDRFDPQRFMGPRPKPHVYMPFGAGSHRCIGAAFARFELNVALTTILREFEFELLDHDDNPWVQHGLPLGPGAEIRLAPRTSRA